MKKTIIFSTVIFAMLAFAACSGNKAKSVKLNSEIDSLSYALGLSQGDQFRQFFMKNDTTGKYINEFFAGFEAGMKAPKVDPNDRKTNLQKEIGQSFAMFDEKGFVGDSTIKFNYNLLRQGMINGLTGKYTQLNQDEIVQFLNNTMQKHQAEQLAIKFKAEKEAGEKFIAEIAKKEGIQKTPAGVYYEVITQGTGAMPTDADTVVVNYTGKLINDTIFDSNAKRGKPVEFVVTQVIKGWTDALKIMPVGSTYRLYIPQELAYGAQVPRGGEIIKPFSPLIFDVELVGIKKFKLQKDIKPVIINETVNK
ncbi:MAG: FKBP-type peptidyl-prolyl cis-trans isomerase [Paludibacter sp.]|nr:FKBP-type peptidyl-prolyl cis-trans isomerase [Paludibacter sp.]